jgi:transposase-like protein
MGQIDHDAVANLQIPSHGEISIGGRIGIASGRHEPPNVPSHLTKELLSSTFTACPQDRRNPVKAASSDSKYSLMDFMREFPDDDACLEHLWRTRYSPDGEHAECPKCKRERVFKHYATKQCRPAWTCTGCGKHVHPTAGTIFHRSSTSLHLWYYAMYLISSTKTGISAKHLGRELGVNYRTAWRMMNRIRNVLMEQDAEPLFGEVEADETAWGGRPRLGQIEKFRKPGEIDLSGAGGRWKQSKKATVFGMVERGGRVKAYVVADRKANTLQGYVSRFVMPRSMIFTDEWPSYTGLSKRYTHKRIRHTENIYVSGDVHTQTIEGFFSNLKRGISGNYHSVSSKWLQGYLNEYVWRYNERESATPMFVTVLNRAAA